MRTRRTRAIADAVPTGWLDRLTENGRLGGGLDLATTENAKSNPSALAIVEEVGIQYFVRLLMRWKTEDPEVTRAVLRYVLLLIEIRRRRMTKLCVDASNEKFFAADLRTEFSGKVNVDLVVSGEAMTYMGERMNFKTYLGNLYVNTIDAGNLVLPDERWVADDARLVNREKGGFSATVDERGNHADTFDAVKLGLNALVSPGGPAFAMPMAIGTLGAAPAGRGSWKNPFAHLFEKRRTTNG